MAERLCGRNSGWLDESVLGWMGRWLKGFRYKGSDGSLDKFMHR